jgi:hypothetical protein
LTGGETLGLPPLFARPAGPHATDRRHAGETEEEGDCLGAGPGDGRVHVGQIGSWPDDPNRHQAREPRAHIHLRDGSPMEGLRHWPRRATPPRAPTADPPSSRESAAERTSPSHLPDPTRRAPLPPSARAAVATTEGGWVGLLG